MLDIATALAQSRQQILTSLLPLFSSPTRPCPRQPKHTGKLITNTTLSIGPHSFPRTKLFLITFDPNPDPDSPDPSPTTTPAPPQPKPFSAWLVERLNQLASQDDRLYDLVQRAGAGEASHEEVVELGRTIDLVKKEERDLFGDEPAQAVASTSRAHGTRGTAQRERTPEPAQLSGVPPYPAVLIEFAEAPGERYLLPSHYSFAAVADITKPQQDTQPVRLECFVRSGQGAVSALEEQRSFGKGKGREVEGEVVPVAVEVAGCTEKAREALLGASRTGRKGDRGGDAIWDEYLASAALPATATQPAVVPRSPSPSPEPEEPRWRLSNYAKIEWVYDDDIAAEQAKKKPPKRTASAVAGGAAKKQKLGQLKGDTASGTHTPASSNKGADTPEPGTGTSTREQSGTPATADGATPPVKKKKNNKTTGQYAGMGRGWRAAAAAAAAAERERAAAEAGPK